MHPLAQLQKLLTPAPPVSGGTVVAIDGNRVSVATKSGVVIATRRDATAYRLGDNAVLQRGELVGKRVDEANLPVFFV